MTDGPWFGWLVKQHFIPLMLIVTVILTIVGLIGMGIWVVEELFYPQPTIVLLKSEWECSSTYKQSIFTGKVWITETRCANYSRKEI